MTGLTLLLILVVATLAVAWRYEVLDRRTVTRRLSRLTRANDGVRQTRAAAMASARERHPAGRGL